MTVWRPAAALIASLCLHKYGNNNYLRMTLRSHSDGALTVPLCPVNRNKAFN
jgi:hypothetical protein